MTRNRDVNIPSEELSLGRKLQDVGSDTRGEKYIKPDAEKKIQKPGYIGEVSSQTPGSFSRGSEDTTAQQAHSRLSSTTEDTNEFEGATKSGESIREEKKKKETGAQITEDEEEGTYEELICLVRQFYVERPANPAAIGHHNIETC